MELRVRFIPHWFLFNILQTSLMALRQRRHGRGVGE